MCALEPHCFALLSQYFVRPSSFANESVSEETRWAVFLSACHVRSFFAKALQSAEADFKGQMCASLTKLLGREKKLYSDSE